MNRKQNILMLLLVGKLYTLKKKNITYYYGKFQYVYICV